MEVRVRMYRQGLGDCFLLTFGAGEEARHVLVDCGTLGATSTKVKMKQVAKDISETTGGHLHLLIATHEHKDHVSGFRDQKTIFDDIEVENVWLAWTEDSRDPLAQQIEKVRGDLVEAVRLGAAALVGNRSPRREERERLRALGEGMCQVLGFFDDVGSEEADLLGASDLAKTVQEAMTWVTMKTASPSFLRPGPPVLEPDWLPGVRVYVLGPPRDPAALAHLGDHGDPELYHLAACRARDLRAALPFRAAQRSMREFLAAQEDLDQRQALENSLPFDQRYRLDAADEAVKERFAAYHAPEQEWRRIDHEWLAGAADLALQLDGQTNNTSLALAFELIEDGRVGPVLLFPADAQVGNWLSWHGEGMEWAVHDAGGGERTVTARDLLARTVLYKVGHHASHNATVTALGLELMGDPQLVAMIPVDRKVALNKHPVWNMPARALYRRLLEKAGGRVLRSDIGWAGPEDEDFAGLFTESQWEEWATGRAGADVDVGTLAIDWRWG